MALIGGAAIGYCVALLIEFGEGWFGEAAPVGAVLLNMAVFGAVIAYIMQMIAFVRLRNSSRRLSAPMSVLWATSGAIVAGVIALVTLYVLFLNPDYRWASMAVPSGMLRGCSTLG